MQTGNINIEKSLSQNNEETNTIIKKDVKNVDEEILKSTENSLIGAQSTSGITKFFYFYQGSYFFFNI